MMKTGKNVASVKSIYRAAPCHCRFLARYIERTCVLVLYRESLIDGSIYLAYKYLLFTL